MCRCVTRFQSSIPFSDNSASIGEMLKYKPPMGSFSICSLVGREDAVINRGESIGGDVPGIAAMGRDDGRDAGVNVGAELGNDVGSDVGTEVGTDVGTNVGTGVGKDVGKYVGSSEGAAVAVDSDGPAVIGIEVGSLLGKSEKAIEGITEGEKEGTRDIQLGIVDGTLLFVAVGDGVSSTSVGIDVTGCVDGYDVGFILKADDCDELGANDGEIVRESDGADDMALNGASVGSAVAGAPVGVKVGLLLGAITGAPVGVKVGLLLGANVGEIGLFVGVEVGFNVGDNVGKDESGNGRCDGTFVGINVGE
mmetsp:Transcript_16588/g.20248  ORF Transcript_16588/g.20248 Transcript_16588/m.20248 type:complete len:308 (+) Transcript_16588:69-992(+)